MKPVTAFCRQLLMALWFVGCPQWASAQLIARNFVYTGSGSQSDALKFSCDAGFFKSPVDLKRFVDGRFINQALNEMK